MKESNRKIKEAEMADFFARVPNMGLAELQEEVFKLINESRSPNTSILRKIPTMSTFNLLKAASDFYLKGSGLGVKK